MENRGQKRPEIVDELPADKRACSSLEFKPSSSNSSIQTPMDSTNPTPESQDGNMDTSSSTSGSNRSEADYGTCDSDDDDYQRDRSSDNHGKFTRLLSSLSEEVEQSGQLAALTELCDLLSFCTDNSLSSTMADSFSPVLVTLARHESNFDIMLLAVRGITYLCDLHPRSSGFLVRHEAVPALCQRLTAIEDLDVAEQCLQALEKISREQPQACLQAGAITGVLNYIDFFSTSVQRVALSTVLNICKTLPSQCPPSVMEAVPVLCNLLQYEDRQLVEKVASCLINIVARVCHSSDTLEELCRHGVIHQVTHLIDLNSGTTLGQPIYTGLIGLLAKLASGSVVAVKTLFEHNISSVLKDIMSTNDLLHGTPSPPTVDGDCNKVHEVLKLLNVLLPAIASDPEVQLASDKETFLLNRPDLLQKFGMDLFPVLIQVVNSGVNLYVCYGCLSVIRKLVYYSKPDMLLELIKNNNLSSFLAGVFTRKDHHVLLLALQLIDISLQKIPDVLMTSFVKEGIFFAVDTLIIPETCNGLPPPSDPSQKYVPRDALRCLCYAFDTGQSQSASESGTCKLEKDSVNNLAKHIQINYSTSELLNRENGLTDILQKLRSLSAALTDLVNKTVTDDEEFYFMLHQIMSLLNGKDPISTFEFVESGIVKSLVNFLFNGQPYVVEKRFEVFGRLFLSSSEIFSLSALIRMLQSALSSVEKFPVILSHTKQKSSYASVPHGRSNSYPCLKVEFVRGEGETCLSKYQDHVTVDPFSSLEEIEGFLWPRVGTNKSKCNGKGSSPSYSPSDSSSTQCTSPDPMEIDCTPPSVVHEMQDNKANSTQSATGEANNFEHKDGESAGLTEVHTDPMEQDQHTSSEEEDTNMDTEYPGSCSNEDASPKLSFYLEGEQIDQALTLYQAILQQQIETGHEIIVGSKWWSQVYRVTYKKALKHTESGSPVLERDCTYWHYTPFFSSMFGSKLFSDMKMSSPAYDILRLLKSMEVMRKYRLHLMSRERGHAFAVGRIGDLDNLKVMVSSVPQNEFVSSKLTEKLEQQMRDVLAVSVGGMPLWCSQLIASCPFLFSFEVRTKYFRLAALGHHHNSSAISNSRQRNNGNSPRKKFLVNRDRVLESATQMMDLHVRKNVVLEVYYDGEVGTGLGPTLEFYTLVGYDFQKFGLGLWREDHLLSTSLKSLQVEDTSGIGAYPFGLFPRPWSCASSEAEFSEVLKKFLLLGQIVAKALQDGRVFDLPFSKTFYKVILGQDLTVYDIQSFDPGLGKALLEFQALVGRKKYVESIGGETMAVNHESCFRDTTIEDLCLDLSLPGYPDYVFISGPDSAMVNMNNLEEYVRHVVDATVGSGISRQVEAFKSGFNQVFPVRHLQIFTEEELERLLCGEREFWNSNDLMDHIKFDHGYTASSPPIINFLEIIREFNHEQQKAFLRFVTGAPRLPTGGLASLNPKLTIVRKHCGKWADADLPSVMTCANYLKLPPYSSKERMREKLLYAIIEGQGSFHLS